MKPTLIMTLLTLCSHLLISQRDIYISHIEDQLVYNNHVGNDWSGNITITYANTEYSLDRHESIVLKYRSGQNNITIHSYIEESDKYPDISSQTINVAINQLDPSNEIFTIKNEVREGHGRYAGNTALWSRSFKITTNPMLTASSSNRPR